MKFHALTLCLASTLVASAASAQDNRTYKDKMHSEMRTDERVDRSSWPIQKPFYTERNWQHNRGGTYTQRFPFFKEKTWAYGPVTEVIPERIAFYTDLPPLTEVAAKIQELHHHNAMEAAEVQALANRARALGWTNIAAVYDQIASDHMKGATVAANWLTDSGFPAPAMPTTATVADTITETEVRSSIDRLLSMHERKYTETLDKLHNEKSTTVRGLYLVQLTTISRHIDLLEILKSDVERGRRDLSNRLASMLDATRNTRTASQWDTMIFEEEWALLAFTPDTTIAAPYFVPPQPEIQIVERPVIVERIVERPVPAPAPAPLEVTSVPKPAYQEATIETTTPRSTVAGQRQTRTRRARRPAK